MHCVIICSGSGCVVYIMRKGEDKVPHFHRPQNPKGDNIPIIDPIKNIYYERHTKLISQFFVSLFTLHSDSSFHVYTWNWSISLTLSLFLLINPISTKWPILRSTDFLIKMRGRESVREIKVIVKEKKRERVHHHNTT